MFDYLARFQIRPVFFQAENGTLSTQLLIVIVLIGLLFVIGLFTVLGYFFLHRIAQKRVAEIEKGVEELNRMREGSQDVTHLPVGTNLKNSLYEVEAYISTANGVSLYRCKQAQPLYLCSQCNTELDSSVNAFCRSCGAEIDVTPPTYPTYLIRESENIYPTVEQLIGMNLEHSSLILPVDYFTDNSLGVSRYYLVEPFDQNPTLSSVRTPLPVIEALRIGVSLAEGMAYLHNFSAIIKNVRADAVAYIDGAAKWLGFGNIQLLRLAEDESYDVQFSNNTKDLTLFIEKLMVGEDLSDTPVVLPDEVTELVNHYKQSGEKVTADNLARSLRQAKRMLGGHNQVKYRLGSNSDVGRLRKLNEDSMFSGDLSPNFEHLDVTVVIAAVADGVGGHAAGDVASQLTVSAINDNTNRLKHEATSGRLPEARQWIVKSAMAGNEEVYKERTKAGNNMACTLVMAFFTGDLATILNVGDSRAYLLNSRGIRQITTDHSLVERLVSIGELTREEARHHPRKSVIYRVIGDRLNLDYDIFEQTLVPGEALLLCSDGLTDMVEDGSIWRIWRGSSSPQQATDQLVSEANAAGGTDNITVVIIEVAA